MHFVKHEKKKNIFTACFGLNADVNKVFPLRETLEDTSAPWQRGVLISNRFNQIQH